MEKKTPLYQCHIEAGGKMVPFAGYLLPVQYAGGVIEEHNAVRTKAGLFDVSHMAELVIEGRDAQKNVDRLLTVKCADMTPGQAKYSPMCNERGGIVDDLMIYCVSDRKYLLVVNAANHEKDVDWIRSHLEGDVVFSDISDSVAQLALQGPKSQAILSKLVKEADIPSTYYTFTEECPINLPEGKTTAIVSQTGYTGEHGFEIYCDPKDAVNLWNALLECGREEGLIPCGLGARDTLRLEASMPLYGHEMNDEITPIEAGLGFFVKMDKPDFIGKAAIETKGKPQIKRVGLIAIGRGILREHCGVYLGDEKIGVVTSGTFCPFIEKAAGMAYLPVAHAAVGNKVEVDVRGRRVEAEIVKMPFYKRA